MKKVDKVTGRVSQKDHSDIKALIEAGVVINISDAVRQGILLLLEKHRSEIPMSA